MPRRARLFALLLVFSAAAPFATVGERPARADTMAVPNLPFERTTLANGLEVIIHEDHRTPVVSVDVWYHVGSKDEPAGRSGFAHLFEHMMFQGSRHVPEDTYFLTLERAGATNVNGTTNDDRTNYFETVPSNRLELALWLESDRMGFLLDHVDEASFEGQRKVVKRERGQNYETRPYGLVDQFIREALFPPTHPYHHITIGSTEDLDRAKLDDVRQFFNTFYVPDNATLAIVGDVKSDDAKALVEKYFGPIPRGSAPVPRATAAAPPLAGETRVEVAADVELPRVLVDWITPPMFAPGDGELDVLARVLAHGKSSRLYKRLVYDMQAAQSVSAVQGSMQLASQFEIDATVKPGHTADEVLKAIDEELAKLQSGGLDDAELGRAKTGWNAEMVFALERTGVRAEIFETYAQFVNDPGYLPKDVARHDVSARAVKDACVTYLPPHRRVVTIVTPTKGAPLAGQVVRTTRQP